MLVAVGLLYFNACLLFDGLLLSRPLVLMVVLFFLLYIPVFICQGSRLCFLFGQRNRQIHAPMTQISTVVLILSFFLTTLTTITRLYIYMPVQNTTDGASVRGLFNHEAHKQAKESCPKPHFLVIFLFPHPLIHSRFSSLLLLSLSSRSPTQTPFLHSLCFLRDSSGDSLLFDSLTPALVIWYKGGKSFNQFH